MVDVVECVDVSGSEELISKVAGISRKSETGPTIENLIKWGHFSPFEFASITFYVKCPIFVARQLMRHRTGSYMEKSLRYCNASPEYYKPDTAAQSIKTLMDTAYYNSFKAYEDLVSYGVDKEDARAVLPVGLLTEFYVKYDLRNLYHMLKLRLSNDAQKETGFYADLMLVILNEYFPTIATNIYREVKN